MGSLPGVETGAISDSTGDSVTARAPVKRRISTSAQSLSSRAESFAPFGEECEEVAGGGESGKFKVGKWATGIERTGSKIAIRNEGFQKDDGILGSLSSESLATLDGSRAKSEKLAEHQQLKMGNLLAQTKQVIIQRQTANGEMKQQQWALNSEFAKLEEWRIKVEKEMLFTRSNRKVIQEKASQVHDQSQSSVDALWGESQAGFGAIREELIDMRKQNRNRVGNVHGANHTLFGGVKDES